MQRTNVSPRQHHFGSWCPTDGVVAIVLAVSLTGCAGFWGGLGRPNPVPRDGVVADERPLHRPGAEGLDALGRARPMDKSAAARRARRDRDGHGG